MNNSENATAPVAVVADRTLIGFLAAVTNTDAKIVMCNLRDMATTVVDRLRGREYGWDTWGKVEYPGTGLKLRVSVKRQRNTYLHRRLQQEYHDRFEKETGHSWRARAKKKRQARDAAWTEWSKVNPYPHVPKDLDVTYLMTYFKVATDIEVMMTQDEIDTTLVEQILLAPREDEADD